MNQKEINKLNEKFKKLPTFQFEFFISGLTPFFVNIKEITPQVKLLHVIILIFDFKFLIKDETITK